MSRTQNAFCLVLMERVLSSILRHTITLSDLSDIELWTLAGFDLSDHIRVELWAFDGYKLTRPDRLYQTLRVVCMELVNACNSLDEPCFISPHGHPTFYSQDGLVHLNESSWYTKRFA